MKIQKTLSIRILRPLYPPDIEAEMKKEKTKRNETEGTGHLDGSYFKELKKKHPNIITAGEFFSLLSEMQRSITGIYNKTISQLYHRLIVNKENISPSKALSEGPYHDFKSTFNSYIALGLRQKVQSNFKRQDLKTFKIALPTAKSDRFPIPIYKQNRFKVEKSENDDFIIELPLMEYNLKGVKDKKYNKIELCMPPKIKNIPVILSTLRRRESGQWFKDEGTNTEISRVLTGEYKVSSIEIIRRTRFGKHADWFVNMSIKHEKSQEGLDPAMRGGIDIGLRSPLVCAINMGLDRCIVKGNDIFTFNKKALARRRTLLKRNRFKRSGHGSKTKLEPITILSEKN